MANTEWTVAGTSTSSATFRAWGLALSTALAAIGLVNTTDTGQINWTTVAVPGAGATDAGYEIWRFNDGLQSTFPVFLKFYYGSAANATLPRIRVEVGTGSNGTGTITGTGSGTITTVTNLGNSSAAVPSWAASDSSGLVVNLWGIATISAEQSFFLIDRFRDGSGAANGLGVAIIYCDSTSTSWHTQVIDFGASLVLPALSDAEVDIPVTWSSTTSNLTSTGQLPAYPAMVFSPSGFYTLKMALAVPTIDLAYDSKQTATVLGAARTYRSLGARFISFGKQGLVSAAASSPMMWWSD